MDDHSGKCPQSIAKICTSRYTKYCAVCAPRSTKYSTCHEICSSRPTKYCACHEIRTLQGPRSITKLKASGFVKKVGEIKNWSLKLRGKQTPLSKEFIYLRSLGQMCIKYVLLFFSREILELAEARKRLETLKA